MKTPWATFLRGALYVLLLVVCGMILNAHADESVSVSLQITGRHNDAAVTDFDAQTNINASYGVYDAFRLEKTFSSGDAYANYDLERNIVGGYVYHSLHISGSAINSGFETFNGGADAVADSAVQISEQMMIEYVPDSATDTPPTSVSFQESYLLQGQLQIENDDWSISAYNFGMQGSGDNPTNYTITLSTNIVSSATTVGLNQLLGLPDLLGAFVSWDSSAPPGVSSTFDLGVYFQGYVNFVDQNGQPIPSSKLIFWCVNPNDTTQRIPFASEPNLSIEEAITLEAIPGTNSLTLQWPAYASNYQLQTALSLENAAWTTNALPPPVVNGPFLQVAIPATNIAAFFRLRQSN